MIPSAGRLIADRLTCRRGERILFENLSFSIERGSGLVLTGPNGVGKTTVLNILGGLLAPTAGAVRVEPATDIPLPEQSHFVGVRDGLKAVLTPREHIDFWISQAGAGADLRFGRDRDYQARDILAEYRLDPLASIPCGWLSTGQRRRVALARLHCGLRDIWLLDEPLNGLDERAVDELGRTVARFMAAGGILVAASHQALDWPDISVLRLGVPGAEQYRAEEAAS